MKKLFPTLLLILTAFCATVCFSSNNPAINEATVTSPILLADESYGVEIKAPVSVKDNTAELEDAPTVTFGEGYVIIHGTSGKDAKALSDLLWSVYKLDVPYGKDSTASQKYEILSGSTNRPLSKKIVEMVNEATNEGASYAWGYAVEGETLAFYASGTYGSTKVLEELEELFFTENGFQMKDGTLVVRSKSIAEHEEELAKIEKAKEEAKKQERLDSALAQLDAFKGSDVFGEAPSLMPANDYPDPEQYPTYGVHPRIFVNSETIDEVKEIFFNPPDELKHLVERTLKYADFDFNGVFPEKPGKTYTYDATLFKYMEAKAFMYLMTGDEVYGYEAILCAKNCILTMVYTKEIFKDTYRGASHAIAVITEIYDWCYDLMTEEDKFQIINGSKNYLFDTLEFNYPPSNMGYISGHGMAGQFLRDYLGFALAIYDERPDWWDYVGGRFYSQYCLGINYCLEGGYYSQGTSCYAPGKCGNIYSSAWLVERATGTFPYVDGLRDLPYFMLSQLMPNNRYFEYGDGATTGYGAAVNASWLIMAVGTYNDPTIYAAAKNFSSNFTNIDEDGYGNKMTAMTVLIYLSGCAGSEERFAENLPLIEYTGSPAGITVARDAWNDTNAAAVYMKIGELYMSNHDHRDSGTFQIYYKGLLAGGNAGQYNVYGTEHWKYYHQATIANNGLLVFDPDLYEEAITTPLLDENGNEMIDKYGNPMYKVLNPAKAFYTGSQRAVGESSSFDNLVSGLYDFGKVTGHLEGYKQNGDAKFAYLAGDLTSAYEANTAAYVGRSMLTVFTDDPDFPMYFFVFDNVTPVIGDDDVLMKFLLHSVNEPVVSGNRVTVENEGGQLTLINVTENSIETLGGPGNKYNINGINLYEDTYEIGLSTGSKQDNDDKNAYWGRTEVTASAGESGNRMLNVMYVADKGERESLNAALATADGLTGTVIESVAVFFADNSEEFFSSATTVNVDANEDFVDYYFCGLNVGTWKIYIGEGEEKQFIGTTYASNDTRMITFKAPAGTITIEPGEDIRPSNSGKIYYRNVTEAVVGPEYYIYDSVTPLPSTAVNGNSEFIGWYLDQEFTQPIKEIDGSLFEGSVTVFAKFKFMYANESYEWAKNDPINNANFNKNGITYSNAEDKTVNYKTEYSNGKGYVVWTGSTGGPVIGLNNSQSSIASLAENSVTYTFSLAKNGDDMLLGTVARVFSSVSGVPAINLFTTDKSGKLSVCGYTYILTDEFFTFSVELNFEDGKLIAYDEIGNKLGESNITIPEAAGVSSALEWKEYYKSTVLNWRNNGAGGSLATIRIGLIRIEAGGFITDPDECVHRDRNDDGICDRCKTEFSDGCEHYDADDDKACDKCAEPYDDGCDHRDADDNGACDKCDCSFDDGCEICRDKDDNGKCDRCAKVFSDGCDNHTDKDDNGKCDVAGCNKDYDDGCNHFDKNDDKKCDKCQESFTDGCDIHRDADDDGLCDNGGEAYDDGEELPEGQWAINYEAYGAPLPSDAPKIHYTGTATTLPTSLKRDGYVFGGWYTDESFTTRLDEIDAETNEPIKVFAKWNYVFYCEDYSFAENESTNSSSLPSRNGLSYGKTEDALVNYETRFENGDGYIIWTGSTGGPVIIASQKTPSISTIASDKVKLTVSIAKCENEALLNTNCRIFDDNGGELIFFNTSAGKLNVAGKSIEITEEFFTFSVVMDFSDGYIRAYDEDGVLIGEKLYAIPAKSGVSTYSEWKALFASKGSLNFRNNGVAQDKTNDVTESGKIKISLISLEEY